MDERAMIERALARHGLNPDSWDEEAENGLTARFDNDWIVMEESEERGLYDGDTGKLSVCVVGAEEHGNQRVSFSFTPEGQDPDSGSEVEPFEDIEPA